MLPDAPEELPAETVAAPGQLTAAAVREVWPEIISDVGRKSKKVAALASGATVRELDGQTVVLTFRFPAHAKMVSDQPHLIVDALYEALEKHHPYEKEDAEANLGMGDILLAQGKREEARAKYQKAFELRKTYDEGKLAQQKLDQLNAMQSTPPA